MSCTVKVLVNVAKYDKENDYWETVVDEATDYDTFREELKGSDYRYNLASYLREVISDWMEEYYRGTIEYVKDYIPNTDPDSDEFILGVERPDEIRKIVKNWNLSNSNRVIQEVKHFEDQMVSAGFTSLSEFLSSMIKEDGSFGRITYPASFYSLRKALDTSDDMFTYDSADNLVHVEYKNEQGQIEEIDGVRMDDDTKREIIDHPERYALIEVCYD